MLDTRRRRVEKVSEILIKLAKLNFKENSFLYLSVSLLDFLPYFTIKIENLRFFTPTKIFY